MATADSCIAVPRVGNTPAEPATKLPAVAGPGCDPPSAPADKPAGYDHQPTPPVVEPLAYPPCGDYPCAPQAHRVGPGEESWHAPIPPTPDP